MRQKTTGAGASRAYSEYNMWLQPLAASAFAPVRITAGEGVPPVALAELSEGLCRLFGEGSVSPGAAREIALSTDASLDASLPPEGYRLEGSASGARLTFGGDEALLRELTGIMMRSRYAYEKYTTPLGLCWMVNVRTHYGPSPDGYEYMRWGAYHRADATALGVDRTSGGTGFTKQYRPRLTKLYDDPETCPEDLLLYFHRVPYGYVMKSGETLLQHLYDAHFQGAEEAEGFAATWDSLKDKLPESAYESVRERFLQQVGDAREWRDVFNTYFYRKTGIPDEKGRKIYE